MFVWFCLVDLINIKMNSCVISKKKRDCTLCTLEPRETLQVFFFEYISSSGMLKMSYWIANKKHLPVDKSCLKY